MCALPCSALTSCSPQPTRAGAHQHAKAQRPLPLQPTPRNAPHFIFLAIGTASLSANHHTRHIPSAIFLALASLLPITPHLPLHHVHPRIAPPQRTASTMGEYTCIHQIGSTCNIKLTVQRRGAGAGALWNTVPGSASQEQLVHSTPRLPSRLPEPFEAAARAQQGATGQRGQLEEGRLQHRSGTPRRREALKQVQVLARLHLQPCRAVVEADARG